MKKYYIVVGCIFLFFTFLVSESYPAAEDGYIKVKCVVHVHTTASSGYLTVEDYSRLAEKNGVDAVILTDDLLQRYEYGLWPLRGILKKVVENGSILKYGSKEYLELIRKANMGYKDVIIIDGAEANPFYFWTGNVFQGNLALNNRNKDMLVIGLGDAKRYNDLPIVGGRHYRFDQYHGDKFLEPYQDVIDYVNQAGGLTFWSHPEIEENLSIKGIRLITIPYSYDLLSAKDYTGFGIFAEGYKTVGTPIGIWDRILTEYCLGKRSHPIWAIGELEYGGDENKNLNDTINVLYVKKLNREDILDAFKKGRFYVASKEPQKINVVLNEFVLNDMATGKSAMMGETLVSDGVPSVKIRLSHEKFIDEEINVKLIRNNQIIREFSGKVSADLEFNDEGVKPDDSVYYRIDAESQGTSRLISNPIFFRRVGVK